MDFKLTDEQELICDSYRDLMESENWEHYFHECDEAHTFPNRWVARVCELGFDRVLVPEEHGGLGLDEPYVTLMAITEVLGRYGAPIYTLYMHAGYDNPILREGTPEQVAMIKDHFGTGSRIWNPACTEPGAGSDVKALTTTYKRENGKVYINGTKTFITSAMDIKYLLVMCRDADNPDVYSEFFVDMEKPGVSKSPLPKLGLRMDNLAEVYFDNVEVEESDLFGTEGNGFGRGITDFNIERWFQAAGCYGHALCAFEDAAKYAWNRTAHGRPIARFQLSTEKFANMATKLKLMRGMLYEAAWNADQNNGILSAGDSAMCKYYCARTSFEVIDDAMQIFAGIGVASEHRIIRFWRDVRIERVGGGTDEMTLLTCGKAAIAPYRD